MSNIVVAKLCSVGDDLARSIWQVPGNGTFTGACGSQYRTRRFDALHVDLVSMFNAAKIDVEFRMYQCLGSD
jgi:hypothetical protein